MSERGIDITTAQRKLILDLLGKHLPNTSAWAYGSRVTWKARPQSDLDMVVFATPEQAHAVANLKEAFEESDLPFRVDLFAWHEVPEQFQKNITAEHVVLVERQEDSVPDGWAEISLRDIFSVKHGFAFKGEYFTDAKQKTILVTPGNFSIGGGFQNQKPKYYNGPIPEGYVLNAGDVVVTMTDLSKQTDTLGYSAVIPYDSNIWLHNQRVGLIEIKDKNKSSSLFINYLLRTHPYRSWIIGSATGTTVKHTSPNRIEAFRCTIPPVPEQRAIAHILGSLDDKIVLNRRMNATLEGMAQALFKSWFVDFDVVIDKTLAAGNSIPEPLQARAAVRESLGDARKPLPEDIQALFPDAFEHTEAMGWVPMGWEVQPLYDIANFINGAAYRDFHFTDEAGALPIVKIAEIKNGISGQTKFTKTALAEKYRIADGDILFSWSGNPDTSIDTFVWTGGPGWLNQHIFKVDLYSQEDRNFVYYQLKSLRPTFAEIARNKQTTGLGHVTAQDMKRLFVIKCSGELLKAFNHCTGHLFDKWHANLLETKKLADIRDTFLPKLLSGELRIHDAGKFVEGL